MRKTAFILTLIFCVQLLLCCTAEQTNNIDTSDTSVTDAETQKNLEEEPKMKFGAYVWYGFSYEGAHYTDRLYSEFSGRQPVWGWTEDSVSNMEYQIELAREYGLSFFAFDWYYGNARLNQAVNKFIRADGSENMEFCLLVANHDGARITYENWEDACKYFVSFMSRSNSLKVDGKPVIIFYDITNMVTDLGGVEKVKECFDYLRDRLSEFGGAYIMGCECPYGTPSNGAIDFNYEAFSPEMLIKRLERDKACGFDALTGYNYRRYSPINGSYELSYKTMTEQHEQSWNAVAEYSDIAYAPCVLSGWDCRPWETDWPGNTTGYRSCYAPDRSAEVFTEHLLNAYKWTVGHPEQSADNIALIYAWDEVCEGGFLIPTVGEGFTMLEGLKAAVDKINAGQ